MAELRFGNKSIGALDGLLDRLASNDPDVRADANRELESIPVQDVIRTLEASFTHLPRAYQWTAVLVGLGAGSLVFLAGFWSWHLLAACFFSALGFVVGLACTSTAIMPALRQRILVTIGERLEEVTDVRDLGMILDFIDGVHVSYRRDSVSAFSQYPVKVKNSLRAALSRLLPQVNGKVYKMLTRTQLEAFGRLLEEPYLDTELTLAIVRTIGEYDDLKNFYIRQKMQAFAEQPAVTANMKQVKSAARFALERVAERRERVKVAHTLLRGSSPPTQDQSAALLRPAQPHADSQQEQLLRAGNSESPES